MDIRSTGMNRLELTQEIQRELPDIRIGILIDYYFLTASGTIPHCFFTIPA
jgi:DNA-binding NarL/FixJ family response regulator